MTDDIIIPEHECKPDPTSYTPTRCLLCGAVMEFDRDKPIVTTVSFIILHYLPFDNQDRYMASLQEANRAVKVLHAGDVGVMVSSILESRWLNADTEV